MKSSAKILNSNQKKKGGGGGKSQENLITEKDNIKILV